MKTNNMKKDILEKFGANSTGDDEIANDDIQFPEVTLSDGTKSNSFYTFYGYINILDDQGMDIDFDEYSTEDQELLYNAIMSNENK